MAYLPVALAEKREIKPNIRSSGKMEIQKDMPEKPKSRV
jgi:hypothetical protein